MSVHAAKYKSGRAALRCVANPGYVFAAARIGYVFPLSLADVAFENVQQSTAQLLQ